MSAGLSITGGGDQVVILAAEGGDAFAQRLQDLRQAKADAEAAFQELRLGVDATRAWDEVNAHKATIDHRLAGLDAELAEVRERAQADANVVRANASGALEEAQERAKEILIQAELTAHALTGDLAAAQAAAAAELDAAKASRAEADAARAQAEADSHAAVAMMEEAKSVKDKADALIAAFHSVIENLG